MLLHKDGSTFATGVTPLRFGPASTSEASIRAIINVNVDGFQTEGFIDTGGVFFILNPEIAKAIGLTPDAQNLETIMWRGMHISGSLHRMTLELHASDGYGLRLEATSFVPFMKDGDEWVRNLPCVLGLQGCLDRMRFAIDPVNDNFYFGPLN